MRVIIAFVLLMPLWASAQFKRSATELAKENIREYLTTKLFKNSPYQSVSYGQLVTLNRNHPGNDSYIEHKFTITEIGLRDNKKDSVQRLYDFIFFFDDKMRVTWAERLISN